MMIFYVQIVNLYMKMGMCSMEPMQMGRNMALGRWFISMMEVRMTENGG